MITNELQRVQSLQQDINPRVSLWGQLAQAMRIVLPSPIRAIISHWGHIQPIVEELWGRRNLSEVIRRGLEEPGIGTLADLQNRMDDLSNYLRLLFGSEEVLRRWLHQQMKEAAREASALLWRCEKPAYHKDGGCRKQTFRWRMAWHPAFHTATMCLWFPMYSAEYVWEKTGTPSSSYQQELPLRCAKLYPET